MKRSWLLVLLISLGLNLGLGYRLWQQRGDSGWSPPQTGGHGGGRHGGPALAGEDSLRWRTMAAQRLDLLADRLDLSDDQKTAMQEVQERRGRLIQRNFVAVESYRRRLHGMIAAETIDAPAVRAAIHELGRRQAVLDSVVTEVVLQELEILDPAQRALYRRIMPFERGRRGTGRRGGEGRPGPRGGPGPGGQ